MTTDTLTQEATASPVGAYEPEVLILAPEDGEDSNTLSLVSQCLELGIAIELDENWRLPTQPPRDLSAYKACLFPDSSKSKYDADLNAFQNQGGFLVYSKYYPVSQAGTFGQDHCVDPVEFHGRDILMFHYANMLLQAPISQRNPEFVRAMRLRPLASILDDQHAVAKSRYEENSDQPWSQWKDPDCFFLEVNRICSDASGNPQWRELMLRTFDRVAESHQDLLRTDRKISAQLENVVEPYVLLFSWLLSHTGHIQQNQKLTDAGTALGQFWFEHNGQRDNARSTMSESGSFGEDVFGTPALYWLTRTTGDQQYARFADRIFDRASADCQRPDGIWSHWVDHQGTHQSSWCRANAWSLFGLVLSLEALTDDVARTERLLELTTKTYNGLAEYQDEETGLWRCVIDEPFTRIETSGTTAFIFMHDRLKALGLAETRHTDMIERAFEGVLPLCYRQGVGSFCRGTDYGSKAYYRSRPLGYSPTSSFWAPCVAARNTHS